MLINFEASDRLRTQNEAIRQRMFELLTQARDRGQLVNGLDLRCVKGLALGLPDVCFDPFRTKKLGG